jgi:hypothetical protein
VDVFKARPCLWEKARASGGRSSDVANVAGRAKNSVLSKTILRYNQQTVFPAKQNLRP